MVICLYLLIIFFELIPTNHYFLASIQCRSAVAGLVMAILEGSKAFLAVADDRLCVYICVFVCVCVCVCVCVWRGRCVYAVF